MRLKDKVAIITGAGLGMGREASVLFASEGAKIIGLDINEKTLNELQNRLGRRSHPNSARVVPAPRGRRRTPSKSGSGHG